MKVGFDKRTAPLKAIIDTAQDEAIRIAAEEICNSLIELGKRYYRHRFDFIQGNGTCYVYCSPHLKFFGHDGIIPYDVFENTSLWVRPEMRFFGSHLYNIFDIAETIAEEFQGFIGNVSTGGWERDL